ncbi:hypothetical protein B0J13DRAFT_596547 [Dactylonectria estremocensis]|uniref:Protein-arginine deiminase C-terminal domain-containing protein n=1 Tax=Dactylonectria estremocensis TaxID=1079267 RepID=A0A9P9EL95_9HYPO|nr:hypothetical protein B0J13DRAFT_596547 [Dactylonectria estremocensis]
MWFFSTKTAVLALALCHTGQALKATILADTNRDGKVDIKGTSDNAGKKTWTADRGALFLANIGDTDGRCAKSAIFIKNKGNQDSGETYLNDCNDASGNVQRNAKFLAPLRTLPYSKLSASAKGTVHVTGATAAKKVRVFVKKNGKWVYVSSTYKFTSQELKRGLELGIDARDVRRPGGWDGRATVVFTVTEGKTKATDSVMLRVAPVLTHHHVQPAQRVFTTADRWGNSQTQFVKDLVKNVASAGIKQPVFQFETGDIWTQDFFEPGYTSIPGRDGPKTLRIMLRSVQDYRIAGREIFERLRTTHVGAVQQAGSGHTIDSMGNLETIPPYTLNGKRYPAGRVIQGHWDSDAPLMFKFLQAQESQSPLALDTAWLGVGHVDEFIQFLPSTNKRGWVLMADDPRAGLALLNKAVKGGHGAVKALSRPRLSGESEDLCLPEQTISEVLKLDRFAELNEMAAKRIDKNIQILKKETGLTDKEIFRVPGTFYLINGDGGWSCNSTDTSSTSSTDTALDDTVVSAQRLALSGGPASKAKGILEAATPPGGLSRRQVVSQDQLVAFYPGAVNNVVLTGSQVLAPNPWGPVINGKDIFAEAISAVYAKVHFNVTYQDDWFSHHTLQGEIHCGSNTWRTVTQKWW